MLCHGACCTGEEGKAWTPTARGGSFGQPRAAPSVAGEVHHNVGRYLRKMGSGRGQGAGGWRVRGMEGGG